MLRPGEPDGKGLPRCPGGCAGLLTHEISSLRFLSLPGVSAVIYRSQWRLAACRAWRSILGALFAGSERGSAGRAAEGNLPGIQFLVFLALLRFLLALFHLLLALLLLVLRRGGQVTGLLAQVRSPCRHAVRGDLVRVEELCIGIGERARLRVRLALLLCQLLLVGRSLGEARDRPVLLGTHLVAHLSCFI